MTRWLAMKKRVLFSGLLRSVRVYPEASTHSSFWTNAHLCSASYRYCCCVSSTAKEGRGYYNCKWQAPLRADTKLKWPTETKWKRSDSIVKFLLLRGQWHVIVSSIKLLADHFFSQVGKKRQIMSKKQRSKAVRWTADEVKTTHQINEFMMPE